ncbi:MAG: disulfide bond formation protein B [Candidatus Taylorbacteria bacterium]|nr:disulfide bond formation protein B [Candidatus Taylorbacteria bacterium]
MQTFASFLNLSLGALVVVANLLSLGILLCLASPRARESRFARFFSKNSLLVAFVASLAATLGSLAYSDIIGYEPCKLCWFQRIFMYPQVLIFGIALWRKEPFVRLYGLVLSILGALVALFHYLGQVGVNPLGLDCLAVGYSASCAKNFVLTFGYVTIPMMALSAFVLMSLALTLSLKADKASAPSL